MGGRSQRVGGLEKDVDEVILQVLKSGNILPNRNQNAIIEITRESEPLVLAALDHDICRFQINPRGSPDHLFIY